MVDKMLVSNTSERLRQLMQDRHLRQADILEKVLPFCEQYGIRMNRSDISQYLSGKVVPSQRKLSVLSKALNVQEPWLMGYDVPMSVDDQVPLLTTPDQPLSATNAPAILRVDSILDACCDFVLIVEGDAMEPTIKNGDVVFVCKQDDISDGQIVAVSINSNITLKRFYHTPAGIQLISENPKYPPQTYDVSCDIILGKAIAYKRAL